MTDVGWEQRPVATVQRYRDVAQRAFERGETLLDDGSFTDPVPLERLIEFLREQIEHADNGELPWRRGGFALTRYMGDFEWRPAGEELENDAYELQRIWSDEP
jgi:hypothetical protein